MRYEVIDIYELYDIIKLHKINDNYVKINELLRDIRQTQTHIIAAVKPNRLPDIITHIESYLQGEMKYAKTLTDLSEAINVTRPTLNEWRLSKIVTLNKSKQGYDITDLLGQLKKYASNHDGY